MARKTNTANSSSHSSTLFWLFAIFITWIPIVNVVMVLYWAFAGDNPTRKNYFRAIIIWFLIGFALWLAFSLVGLAPAIVDFLDQKLNGSGSSEPQQ
ncbi:hypothetical protein IEN85_17750 [Pelagicoccus sp. NFK12]|uniref:Uncharacterized protein n=1 Tax=Pelagicoccus enzymogenes TaxID=2773457 RepID=A0A927IJB2_9BACT|nr:hypothetical protein [Pelagicoccus enzymogenes]MBD5781350.1 hypothetical protein [Pelagicoccus enzymogenes]